MDFVEQLKSSVDIVSVVGEYVRLRRSGANRYMGLCPFHNEKSPSFTVHVVHQFYKCFSCGASGDVFKFVHGEGRAQLLRGPQVARRALRHSDAEALAVRRRGFQAARRAAGHARTGRGDISAPT